MDFEFKFKIINFNLETNMSKMLFFNIWSKSLFFLSIFYKYAKYRSLSLACG